VGPTAGKSSAPATPVSGGKLHVTLRFSLNSEHSESEEDSGAAWDDPAWKRKRALQAQNNVNSSVAVGSPQGGKAADEKRAECEPKETKMEGKR
jgi:hypothetical protein